MGQYCRVTVIRTEGTQSLETVEGEALCQPAAVTEYHRRVA